MKITEVRFQTKPSCTLKPLRYLINTDDSVEAIREAKELLKRDTIHHERYRATPAIQHELHEINYD